MIRSFDELNNYLKNKEKLNIVIAGADWEEIELTKKINKLDIVNFILVGNAKKIKQILADLRLSEDKYEIIDATNDNECVEITVDLIRNKQADLPMKGLVHTSTFMKGIFKINDKDSKKRVSQITMFEYDNRLLMLSDCAINIELDIECKKAIIENAVEIANKFGYDLPKVALLSPVEMVNPKLSETIDSAILSQMNRRKQITNCIIDGPLSLDNAISLEAVKRKNIESEVAGVADILIASCLAEANSLSKAIHYFANFKTASIIAGTKIPIIMTSRSDSIENKINSILATLYLLHKNCEYY